MMRILGIMLALALTAAIAPQGVPPAEAAKKKAAKNSSARIQAGGTDVNRLGNRSVDAGLPAKTKAKGGSNLRALRRFKWVV